MVEQAEDELLGIPQPSVPRIPASKANTKKLFRAIRDKIRGLKGLFEGNKLSRPCYIHLLGATSPLKYPTAWSARRKSTAVTALSKSFLSSMSFCAKKRENYYIGFSY